jgi:hypothetical protein
LVVHVGLLKTFFALVIPPDKYWERHLQPSILQALSVVVARPAISAPFSFLMLQQPRKDVWGVPFSAASMAPLSIEVADLAVFFHLVGGLLELYVLKNLVLSILCWMGLFS